MSCNKMYRMEETEMEKASSYTMSYNNMLMNTQQLKNLFENYNWILKENTDKTLIYINPSNHCDEFKLSRATSDGKIEVTAPLWNSPISMTKSFNDYYYAYEFASDKLHYFEKKRNDENKKLCK